VGNVRSFSLKLASVSQARCRHEFEWKREECFLIRKPDPPVLVAITKEPPGRLKTTSIQILDYNLNRCAKANAHVATYSPEPADSTSTTAKDLKL